MTPLRLLASCLLGLLPVAFAHAAFVLETADGLPVEVELVSVYRDEVKVRYIASKREADLSLSKLNPKIQKLINEEVNQARKNIKTLPFNVILEDNSSSKEMPLQLRGFLNPKDAEAGETIKTLPARARCLRLRASTNAGVDVLVDVNIFWYAKRQDSTAWNMEAQEKVSLNVTSTPSEYISKPTVFPRPSYQGYAVIVTNSANGAVLWKGSNNIPFLQDAEARVGVK